MVDAVLSALALLFGAVVIVPLALALRFFGPARSRRIAYLGTGRIDQVFPRNGANLFLERECSDFEGFFGQLWNIHFPAGTRGALDLTPRHHLIDFDVPGPPLLREVVFLAWLLPFLTKHRVAVVTATNPFLQGLNAALVGRLLGLPYAVIITRDFDWDWEVLGKRAFASVFPSRETEARVGRWVLRHASLVLADREYYREFAIRNGARGERTVATRVLADQAYADAQRCPERVRQKFSLGPGPLLTCVGRLDPDKFSLDLLECLALVRERFSDAQLACAGSGSLVDRLRGRAEELGVADGLHLLGSLDLAELPSLVASSDVVVAAHMGYTLVEAGLTGVPIVTYDYDFHREVLSDGAAEWLAPFRDVPAFADRVCRVLGDPARAAGTAGQVRERLLREHSLAAVVPQYQRAYARVLGR